MLTDARRLAPGPSLLIPRVCSVLPACVKQSRKDATGHTELLVAGAERNRFRLPLRELRYPPFTTESLTGK